jgi:hypothetical protein
MKIYRDPEFTDEIKDGELIHFGVVKAGDTALKVIYILNDTEAILQKFIYEFPDAKKDKLTIINSPPVVAPNGTDSFTIKWDPGLDFKRALKTSIKIKAEEIYV